MITVFCSNVKKLNIMAINNFDILQVDCQKGAGNQLNTSLNC
jgi:hypothetical protein